MRGLVPCLLGLVAAACAGTPSPARAPEPAASPRPATPVPAACIIEEPWSAWPGGMNCDEGHVEIEGPVPGILYYRWGPASDSGVELERRSDGTVVWRVHVQPLGVAHSKYSHRVRVRVEGDRVIVESIGARCILEVRDLATGRRISREVADIHR